MILDDWAALWGVSRAALFDLRMRLGVESLPALDVKGGDGSETRQQSLVRIDAATNGVWLTRNNVGALLDARGVPVRYGLANESAAQNKVVKSADLIGIRSVLVGPQHVGQTLGVFVSREVKHEGWTWKGDEHEVAQLNWCNFVLSKGGDAAFCSGPGSFGGLHGKQSDGR
jgi:hypothetical protein